MSRIHFLYHNYKKPLFSTAVIAVVIWGTVTNFWLVSIFVPLVKQPNAGEIIDQWKTANRTTRKHFMFRNHQLNFRGAARNPFQS